MDQDRGFKEVSTEDLVRHEVEEETVKDPFQRRKDYEERSLIVTGSIRPSPQLPRDTEALSS